MKTPITHDAIRRTLQAAALVSISSVLLAGCNNDDDAPDTPAVTLEVPASATVSVAAWTQFAASLPASESADPLRLQAVDPPTSETAEPQPL